MIDPAEATDADISMPVASPAPSLCSPSPLRPATTEVNTNSAAPSAKRKRQQDIPDTNIGTELLGRWDTFMAQRKTKISPNARFGEEVAEELDHISDERKKAEVKHQIRILLYQARFDEHPGQSGESGRQPATHSQPVVMPQYLNGSTSINNNGTNL